MLHLIFLKRFVIRDSLENTCMPVFGTIIVMTRCYFSHYKNCLAVRNTDDTSLPYVPRPAYQFKNVILGPSCRVLVLVIRSEKKNMKMKQLDRAFTHILLKISKRYLEFKKSCIFHVEFYSINGCLWRFRIGC